MYLSWRATRLKTLVSSCHRLIGENRRFSSTVFNPADAHLSGANAAFVESLFQKWKADPSSVHSSWATYFRTGTYVFPPTIVPNSFATTSQIAPSSSAGGSLSVQMLRVVDLVRAYQKNGHLLANIDPLGLEKFRLRGTETNPELTLAYHGLSEADLDKKFNIGVYPNAKGFLRPGSGEQTLREIFAKLQETYAGTIGVEINHLTSQLELSWLRERIETPAPKFSAEEQERFLTRLTWAAEFEAILKLKHPSIKRFGLEGGESAICALREIVRHSSDRGASEFLIGMPHRGRLNVMANVVHKPLDILFAEVQHMSDASPPLVRTNGKFDMEAASNICAGDVKYHQGWSSTHKIGNGQTVHLSLMANPSHLEAVNPVLLGKTKAKQVAVGDDGKKIMAITLHGDASVSGQGIVYESFAFYGVKDYDVGGSIHIIVNNQIGFTTVPQNGRSGPYCSDVGKAFQAPIFHVNGDDPEAVVRVARIAADFRAEFKRDVVIDLVCYRFMGHNEQDNPEFTQPKMYQVIKPKYTGSGSVHRMYAAKLIAEGRTTAENVDKINASVKAKVVEAYAASAKRIEESDKVAETQLGITKGPNAGQFCQGQWSSMSAMTVKGKSQSTAVPVDVVRNLVTQIATLPARLKIDKKISSDVDGRLHAAKGEGLFNWPAGEAIAFATLIAEGVNVRLAGQDAERGTFSHRYAVLHDSVSFEEYCPLKNIQITPELIKTAAAAKGGDFKLAEKLGRLDIINSTLSEFGALGFELGYAMESPNQLNLWEAQFGDFVNGAQIIVDNFLTSGEHKWNKQSGLVLLLPHGYEGQGAEHSSARMERFLQSCNDDPNDFPKEPLSDLRMQRSSMQVVNITTSANYFHALRRQVKRTYRKPLIVFTPKANLRTPPFSSTLSDFSDFSFRPTLPDAHFVSGGGDVKGVRRHVVCSGKVYLDLLNEIGKPELRSKFAITRLEQIAPFPFHAIKAEDARYPNAETVFMQEEHMNMGPWTYVQPRIETAVKPNRGANFRVKYFGRAPSAVAATGSGKISDAEKKAFIDDVLAL